MEESGGAEAQSEVAPVEESGGAEVSGMVEEESVDGDMDL